MAFEKEGHYSLLWMVTQLLLTIQLPYWSWAQAAEPVTKARAVAMMVTENYILSFGGLKKTEREVCVLMLTGLEDVMIVGCDDLM